MERLTINFPGQLVFGNGCTDQFVSDFLKLGKKRTFIITTPYVQNTIDKIVSSFEKNDITVFVDDSIDAEPTTDTFNNLLKSAEEFKADSVVGIGGGSVLDVAKLVAALYENDQTIYDVFGIGNLKQRKLHLTCLPSTSGTGSEVSPNAILLDPSDSLKKGIVSPFLVPDVSYIDPMLTHTVPPAVTAATGIDAMIHCMEAYTNKFAHPTVDMFAIKGVKLIADNLVNAYENGTDVTAREMVSLGSVYGGLCLGPVNTAAVHALSYPLGGEFHIAHGISNAVLLPYVLKFNMDTSLVKHADIAIAMGAEKGASDSETSLKALDILDDIYKKCDIPKKISELGVPQDAIPGLAESAMKVTRLLKNNPRTVTHQDALNIYNEAY